MNLDQSVHLQQRIRLFAIGGILVTGLVVAVATAFPIYRHAHQLMVLSLMDNARSQAQAVGQFLGKATDIGRQIASRSAVRDKLEEYNEHKVGLSELVEYSAPRIRDALRQNEQIAGMVRLDRDGNPVLELGTPLLPVDHALPDDPVSVRRSGPLQTPTGMCLLVSVPILSRDGALVGTDVLGFEFSTLIQLLERNAAQSPTARQLLYNRESDTLVEIGPQGRAPRILAGDDRAPAFLLRAAAGEAGQLRSSGAEGDEMVFFTPVADSAGWSFAFITPAREFDLPVWSRLFIPLSIIMLLVLAGAVLTARAIRPMAEKVLQQSRQLVELGENRQLAASVFEGSPQAVLITDARHRIIDANQACTAITGYTVEELRGRSPCETMCCTADTQSHCVELWQAAEREDGWEGDTQLTRRSGEAFPAWQSITPVRDSAGAVHHFITMFADVSDKRRAEAQIRHLAHHDVLTNLPNRALLDDRLAQGMERSRRSGQQLALLFIDLDRFKHVNDSLGHPVGDRLLKAVAQRFSRAIRDEDTLARQGGDEFVVILEALGGHGDAALVADKLLAALETPVVFDQHEIFVGASIGISLFPDDGDTIEALMRCADSAMYQAKESGRNTFRFYTSEHTGLGRERFELERGLRRALERGELCLHYQAQAACTGDGLTGVESLLRWQHPERGLVLPDTFIPLAEEIGLIGKIGQWVLRTACAQARRWEEAGHPLRVAVNLSGQQISRDGLVDTVRSALAESRLSPGLLELEITEGHILQRVEHCIDTLNQLVAIGVTVAIDDFGTGYSSLSYLKRLPVHRLKIDRSFVEGIPHDRDDVAIVATILSMADKLGMAVIAEGVETRTQLEHLRELGCSEYQGYLLGRPMPPQALEAWMLRAQS